MYYIDIFPLLEISKQAQKKWVICPKSHGYDVEVGDYDRHLSC